MTKGEVDSLIPEVPTKKDFGILAVEPDSAGALKVVTDDNQKATVSLVIAEEEYKGNVTLTDTENGLKAEVDLTGYLKTDGSNIAKTFNIETEEFVTTSGSIILDATDTSGSSTIEIRTY